MKIAGCAVPIDGDAHGFKYSSKRLGRKLIFLVALNTLLRVEISILLQSSQSVDLQLATHVSVWERRHIMTSLQRILAILTIAVGCSETTDLITDSNDLFLKVMKRQTSN